MDNIDGLMKRHGVKGAGYAWFGESVCCWINREPPPIWFWPWPDRPSLPKESVYAGENGWRVGWAPTLPEAFMIALISHRLEEFHATSATPDGR